MNEGPVELLSRPSESEVDVIEEEDDDSHVSNISELSNFIGIEGSKGTNERKRERDRGDDSFNVF